MACSTGFLSRSLARSRRPTHPPTHKLRSLLLHIAGLMRACQPAVAHPVTLVIQAVSHFSYHTSGGQFVLCDLQGGIYHDGAVLTDPVILSRKKLYGPTDLGPTGISSFFSRHVCNEFCRSHWSKPKDQLPYHAAQQVGTCTRAVEQATTAPRVCPCACSLLVWTLAPVARGNMRH